MRRLILFICMLSCNMVCNATSCIVVEENVIARSNKYLKEVYIDVNKSDLKNFSVTISFPLKLEASDLSYVTLFKGNVIDGGEDDFMMPLTAVSEDGRMVVWYIIGRNLSGSNTIEAVYGAPCGSSVRYRVNYQRGSLEPLKKGEVPGLERE